MGVGERLKRRGELNQDELYEIGAKAAFEEDGSDWATATAGMRNGYLRSAAAHNAAVEPLIRADQTEWVLKIVLEELKPFSTDVSWLKAESSILARLAHPQPPMETTMCYICGAPTEYEVGAKVSKCRHYVRTLPQPTPAVPTINDIGGEIGCEDCGCVIKRSKWDDHVEWCKQVGQLIAGNRL